MSVTRAWVAKFVGRALGKMQRQLLDELERRSCYRGVWQDGADYYLRGNSVTHSGGLWLCKRDGTQQRPGTGTDWQLAVKSGR